MIDRRDGVTHRKTHEDSPNAVKGGPPGKIPSTGNPDKAKKHIPSQGPAPGASY